MAENICSKLSRSSGKSHLCDKLLFDEIVSGSFLHDDLISYQ